MIRIDYEADLLKHFVRRAWLDECRYRHQRVRSAARGRRRAQGLTYFTFCASSAVDVFMLEREGLVARDKRTKRLENVFFCEKDEAEFDRIVSLIGSREAGFLGDFKDFVLFRDNRETRGKVGPSDSDEVPSPDVREMFRNKHLHNRYRSLFPLDIINLDPYGNLFPPAVDVHSPMLRAIEQLFEWQANSESEVDGHSCDEFTLMLTAYVDRTAFNAQAVRELETIAEENIAEHADFGTAFLQKFNGQEVKAAAKNAFPPFFCVILPKVIAVLARKHGWFGRHRKICLYLREDAERAGRQYHMMSSVVRYERLPVDGALPRANGWPQGYEAAYVKEICDVVRYKPTDVNAALDGDGSVAAAVKAHLGEVLQYREAFLAANQ